ncbi:hypothetical protein IEQ34_009052 [Dendrobium chrysotoxum]|uniref:DUF4283 domain-containing protein n=1 Tax=Dendrobium chrysotoxum TaxID=161865 RepID=A0AAV7H0Z9_DENCH|nr:hypothetical protein IEQ34_009052 [Dendrobium chrysotoxum]
MVSSPRCAALARHLLQLFDGSLLNLFSILKKISLKLSSEFSVTLLDPRHVLIKLSNHLDYSKLFARRAYYVNNCFMKLIKWTPMFDISSETPIVPMWSSFLDLHPHLFLTIYYMAWVLYLASLCKQIALLLLVPILQ